MIDINECINTLKSKSLDHSIAFTDLLLSFKEGEYIKLIEKGESALRCTVELYRLYRELMFSLYEAMPLVAKSRNVYGFCQDLLGISVERVNEFDEFLVYKITLPLLLPNKRKRKVERNSVITESVGTAVRRFCYENHIAPFPHATVIFLSYHQIGGVTIDSDNMDTAVIMNSLNGRFLRDDRPGVCNTVYYSKVVKSQKKIKTEIFVVDSDHDLEVLSFIKSGCHKQIE